MRAELKGEIDEAMPAAPAAVTMQQVQQEANRKRKTFEAGQPDADQPAAGRGEQAKIAVIEEPRMDILPKTLFAFKRGVLLTTCHLCV